MDATAGPIWEMQILVKTAGIIKICTGIKVPQKNAPGKNLQQRVSSVRVVGACLPTGFALTHCQHQQQRQRTSFLEHLQGRKIPGYLTVLTLRMKGYLISFSISKESHISNFRCDDCFRH